MAAASFVQNRPGHHQEFPRSGPHHDPTLVLLKKYCAFFTLPI
jgi:hypothetical protein